MIWLTGSSGPAIREVAVDLGIGLLVTPTASSYANTRDRFAGWAVDNECFTRGDQFDLDAYLAFLDELPRDGCLFAPAPAVIRIVNGCPVGDAAATWERSEPVLPRIRALGFPAALVAQDGWGTVEPHWDAFDCLFIGGSTRFKLSAPTVAIVQEAKARGLWVHMGRVNSEKRLRYAALIGCDSADGNFLRFAPDFNVERIRRWQTNIADRPALPLWPGVT